MAHNPATAGFLRRSRLQDLLDILHQDGYTCIGPQYHDDIIHYDVLDSVDKLPQGLSQQQAPGHYQVSRAGHQRYFAWANGPQALKPLLFAPREALWQSQADEDGRLRFSEIIPATEPIAVIGVRACDIAALYINDKHFLQQTYRDSCYLARRQKLLLVAVNCTHPADTCFCASTGDGPHVSYGYDLALSELDDGFIVEAHTEKGLSIQSRLELDAVTAAQRETAHTDNLNAAQQQTRSLPSHNLQRLLFENLDHPRWEDIAERCLSCGNCTSVCPTCFCHSEFDDAGLDGSSSNHYRQWDSCFNQGHSYIHGITIRSDTRLRYRQ
ncbi:MAG: sulfite reductase subunit A, partial [Gammaproteobacteria bacterium]|nr:sulfite reductase subunit A [Gammaproteobacteria bacterium]